MTHLNKILKPYSIVLAESGSTTLVASLATQMHQKVISFSPKRLLQNPTNDMIKSGLPYILSFPYKVFFISGESVLYSPVQSSDVCTYKLSDITKLISELSA